MQPTLISHTFFIIIFVQFNIAPIHICSLHGGIFLFFSPKHNRYSTVVLIVILYILSAHHMTIYLFGFLKLNSYKYALLVSPLFSVFSTCSLGWAWSFKFSMGIFQRLCIFHHSHQIKHFYLITHRLHASSVYFYYCLYHGKILVWDL